MQSGRRKTENNEILLRVWWEKKNEKKRESTGLYAVLPGLSEVIMIYPDCFELISDSFIPSFESVS